MAIKVQKPPHKIVALSYLPFDQIHEVTVKHITQVEINQNVTTPFTTTCDL
jgi:hypothetical protein